MSHHIFLKAANVFVFLFFLSSNLYSILGPKETGDPYYSHGRRTYLTPAPFTFGVWGLIYTLLGSFVVYQFFEKPRDSSAVSTLRDSTASSDAVGPAFLVATLLNSMWFYLWQSKHYVFAAIVMCGVTAAVSYVYYALDDYPARNAGETICIHAPFSLWHAWSVVVLALSVFAAFTTEHEPRHPDVAHSIAAILVMVFLAITAVGYTEIGSRRKGDVAGALVIAWFLFGVYAHQPATSINITALVLGIMVTAYALKPFVVGKIRGTHEESAPLLR